MSGLIDSETLLQKFEVDYDPKLLASRRIMFAFTLRRYLAQCGEAELLVASEGSVDRSHPMYPLARACVEGAWVEFKESDPSGEAGCSSNACGPCNSSGCSH